MDDVAEFELRFQRRLRTFAASGVRPSDAAAVARAVVGARRAGFWAGSARTWRRRPLDRRLGWVVVAAAAIVALTAGLPLLPGAIVGGPSPTPDPSPTADAPPTRLGLAYWGEFTSIYVMDWERAEPVSIYDDATAPKCEQASSISVSPDGRWIAYRTGVYSRVSNSMDDCSAMTHIMDLSGRTMASFPGWGETEVPWAHDSSLVATWLEFSASRAIAVHGVDGERRALVQAPERSGENDVSWSEDGSPSVYSRRTPSVEIPIDGSPIRAYEAPPAWTGGSWPTHGALYAPDGRNVAVINEGSLIITTRDGAIVRELALEPPVEYARWSPSSEQIVYAHGNELRRVDVESGAVTMLTSSREPIWPVLGFSPDGNWVLLVVGRTADSHGDLWVVSTNGGEARRIAEDVSGAGWIALPARP